MINNDKVFAEKADTKRIRSKFTGREAAPTCGPALQAEYQGPRDRWGFAVAPGTTAKPIRQSPFLSGMASALDLGGVLGEPEPQHSNDLEAIRHDWLVVGEDLTRAMGTVCLGLPAQSSLTPIEIHHRLIGDLAKRRIYYRRMLKSQAEARIQDSLTEARNQESLAEGQNPRDDKQTHFQGFGFDTVDRVVSKGPRFSGPK